MRNFTKIGNLYVIRPRDIPPPDEKLVGEYMGLAPFEEPEHPHLKGPLNFWTATAYRAQLLLFFGLTSNAPHPSYVDALLDPGPALD